MKLLYFIFVNSMWIYPGIEAFVCPSAAKEVGGICISYHEGSLNWSQARNECKRRYGTDLLVIRNDALFQDVQNAVKGRGDHGFWVGAKGSGGTFTWVNHQPCCGSYWNPGEPNGDGNDCVHAWEGGLAEGLNDVPCEDPIGYICEVQNVVMTYPPNKEVKVRGNSETMFVCVTSGIPGATVRWFKDQRTINITDDIEMTKFANTKSTALNDVIYVTSTLTFSPKIGDHRTKIYCAAMNSVNTLIFSNKTQLNVQYPPKIKRLYDRDIEVGSQLNFSCPYEKGNPEETLIKWTRNGDSKEWEEQILYIDNIANHDDMTYTCTVKNIMKPTVGRHEIGKDSKSFHLNVMNKHQEGVNIYGGVIVGGVSGGTLICIVIGIVGSFYYRRRWFKCKGSKTKTQKRADKREQLQDNVDVNHSHYVHTSPVYETIEQQTDASRLDSNREAYMILGPFGNDDKYHVYSKMQHQPFKEEKENVYVNIDVKSS